MARIRRAMVPIKGDFLDRCDVMQERGVTWWCKCKHVWVMWWNLSAVIYSMFSTSTNWRGCLLTPYMQCGIRGDGMGDLASTPTRTCMVRFGLWQRSSFSSLLVAMSGEDKKTCVSISIYTVIGMLWAGILYVQGTVWMRCVAFNACVCYNRYYEPSKNIIRGV